MKLLLKYLLWCYAIELVVALLAIAGLAIQALPFAAYAAYQDKVAAEKLLEEIEK